MPAPDKVSLKRTNNSDPDFNKLVVLLDQELREIYGALQSTYDQYNQIINLNTVVIAYRDNEPVGCACFKDVDQNTVEIKRMFVKADKRGRGIASAILTELELWAKESGFSHAILESGDKQPDAVGLYQKLGYGIMPNYGQYAGMESSICMRKEL